jgi:hypothetical protein
MARSTIASHRSKGATMNDAYRIRQAEKIFQLFEQANGRPPANSEDIIEWMKTPEGEALMSRHRDARGKIIPDATQH